MLRNVAFVSFAHLVIWAHQEKEVLERLVVLADQASDHLGEVGTHLPFWPHWVAEHHHRCHHGWHRVAVVRPLVRGEIRDGVRLVGSPEKAPHGPKCLQKLAVPDTLTL